MKKHSLTLIFLLLVKLIQAQPGKNGAYTVGLANQVLNKYCPVANNISSGSNTMTLATGPGFSLCPGDLIMIYQAQGVSIDQANTVSYGNILNYNSAGLYEFKYVQSINGNVVTVQTTFTNSYATAGRVQAIKVPQYTTLTINGGGGIVAKAWKDTTIAGNPYRFGGLVVIHATNIVNNGSISASGAGFRGGALVNSPYIINIFSYFTPNTGEGGEKGEGVFGYQTDYDNIGGRNGRGAGGNGGGGANATNAPGGGGANGNNGNTWNGQGVMVVDPNNPIGAWALDPGYIANGNALTNSSGGGRGGYAWANANLDALVQAPGNAGWGGDSRREAGGLGGRPLNNINAESRIYFGGGGGAGHENNSAGSAGGNGGGIVYLIATTGITGNGTITSVGNTAANSVGCNCDGVGGGGAGGSIVIKTGGIAGTQVVNANGGNGGNQLYIVNESEGPGGGGGGGFAAISGGPVVPTVAGGMNGYSQSTAITEMTSNGGTKGAAGQIGPVTTNFVTFNTLAQPVTAAPTVTQSSCTSTLNAFDLNLTFNPANPSYTINWSPIPAGINNNTQTAASGGISPGVYNATIILGGGCSFITTSFTINPAPSPLNFTVFPSYALTCSQQTVFASLNPANSYTWSNGMGVPLSGNTVSFTPTDVGTWTVTGANPSGCIGTQTFLVIQNTVTPTNSVNPVVQAITCNSASAVTFTGTVSNLTVNVQHDWYSPLAPLPAGPAIATSNNTITILSGNIPVGTYTLVTTNLVNGCISTKTVNITSLSAFPTFNIASPTNFSVGCAPLNQTTLSIINPVSTQTPASTCSFTFLPPGFGGVVTPSVVLDPNNSSTITTIPGTWSVIVQDNSNFCRSMLTVPILQNTMAPQVSASALTQTLTCYHPTVVAIGTSSTPYTTIAWNVPSVPPTLPSPTVVIGDIANGPPTSTTSLTYANFTVVATNSLNACISTSVVTISQNFKPPVSSPMISLATPTAIYCTVATAPVVLSAGSSTTTSGGGPTAFPIPVIWEGPSPQTPLIFATTYSAYVAGIYTLTIKDNYNGCLKTGTVNVTDKTQPPVVAEPANTSTLDCVQSDARLITNINGPTTGLMYWYNVYPPGAAFSPTSAIKVNVNPFLCGTPSPSVVVSKEGIYEYIVSNTLTGCQATGTFVVGSSTLTAGIDADKVNGYAPLQVNFTDLSVTSTGTAGIGSVWNFGNGASQITFSNASTSAVFNAPGTYSVVLYAKAGGCVDSAVKYILVELPSKLEVPNVFTPNGDGINDVYFLKAANMTEIKAMIFDRWGNKVYETESTTGNIAWDGKNFNGADCAAGVYFYVISGKGKDEAEYSTKGNISLFR